MGNVNTGEIYELLEGQEPKLGDVRLTEEQANKLRGLEIELRKLELQKIRDGLAKRKPSIEDLERLIEGGVDVHLESNGDITVSDIPLKPLTLNQNLGGEYANE
jgi:hypothetical protein